MTNVTSAIKKIVEEAESDFGGMYIEKNVKQYQDEEGYTVSVECIDIGEESSDFLIRYELSGNSYVLDESPSYISGLPEVINTTAELKAMARMAVNQNVGI